MASFFRDNSLAKAIDAYYHRSSLGHRLGVLVGLGFTILFAIFGFLSMGIVSDSTERILRERLVIAEMAAQEIDRMVARAIYELERAGDFAAFDPRAADLSAEEHMLAHAYGRIGTLSLGVYFLDETGRVVLARPGGPFASTIDFANRAEIRNALQTGETSISSPFVEPNTGKLALAVVVPVKDAKGGILGLLSGFIDLGTPSVREIIQQATKLAETGHAEIVDERGMVMASTDAAGYYGPGEHMGFYARMGKLRQAGVETVPYDLGSGNLAQGLTPLHVMAYAPLSSVAGGVAVGGERDETFAPVARLRNTILFFGAFALAVVLFATLVGTRRLVKPVKALTASAQRISSGDLESRVNVGEGGEIGLLAESLEEMRAKLRESLRELTRWGTELEERVRLRTAELERRNRELSITTAVATAVSQSLDLKKLLNRVLQTLLEHLSLRFAEIYVFADGSLVSRARKGSLEGAVKELQTIHELKRKPWVMREGAGDDVTPILGVPLLASNQAIGLMVAQSARGVTLGVGDFDMLSVIGHDIGLAIANAKLIDEVAKLEAVRELDRLRSEFISSISHELKTPLGFIKGYATTLLRPDVSPAEETRREFLQIIREESEKLEELVENLLDTARLQAGKLAVDKAPVSIPDVARSVVERATTKTFKDTFVVVFPAEFPVVLADQRRIEQVLNNLIDNAIKYVPQGGRISLRGLVHDDHVTIVLEDEGDGIPPEDLGGIFEPFYRVASPLTRQVRGNGLGLSICRGIIEAHGGRIWAESRPGRGSTFLFTLPVSLPAAIARKV